MELEKLKNKTTMTIATTGTETTTTATMMTATTVMTSAGGGVGLIDRDDQIDKWEQKTGVVVGVGSLS